MNFNYICNSSELNKTLSSILEEVINSVSEKMLEDFRGHLDATIYSAPTGSYERYYDRGGFYSGWDIDKSDKYIRQLFFDGNKLISPQNDARNSQMSHGGREGEDIRDMIAAVLNDARYNDWYSYNGGAKYLTEVGNGYWDTYLATIDEKIEKWLNKEFSKYGISRR